MSHSKYLKEYVGHTAEVYELIMEVIQEMKSESLSIPHTFIPGCFLNKFSVSKLATLCGIGSYLHSLIRIKCKQTWMKLQEHRKLAIEMKLDDLFEGTDDFRKYLISVDVVPDSCPAEYMYEVMVDPSVSVKRSLYVRQVDVLINALHNACGGIIAISHDDKLQIKDTTLRFWQGQFVEHISSMKTQDCIKPKTYNISTKGSVITWLEVLPTVERQEFCTSMYLDVHTDGSIETHFIPKVDNIATRYQLSSSMKHQEEKQDRASGDQMKIKTDDPHELTMKTGALQDYKQIGLKLKVTGDQARHTEMLHHSRFFLSDKNESDVSLYMNLESKLMNIDDKERVIAQEYPSSKSQKPTKIMEDVHNCTAFVVNKISEKLKSDCSKFFEDSQKKEWKFSKIGDNALQEDKLYCAYPAYFLPNRDHLLQTYSTFPMLGDMLHKIERCSDRKSFAIEMKTPPIFGETQTITDSSHLTDILVVDDLPMLFLHSAFTTKPDGKNRKVLRAQNFFKARVLKNTIVKLVRQYSTSQSSGALCVIIYPICHWEQESTRTAIQVPAVRCGISLRDIKAALLSILYEVDSHASSKLIEEVHIHQSGCQIENIKLSETNQFYVIEGPPGSGKTTTAEHLCQKLEKCAILCPTKGVTARINHHKKAKAYSIDKLQDVLNLLQNTELNAELKFVIVDVTHYLDYDEGTWRKIFDVMQFSARHMYLIIDSKYQAYMGDKNVNNLKGLVVHYEGIVLSALTEIHHNSRVVAEYIMSIVADLQMPKQTAEAMHKIPFKCCNTLEGDGVKYTNVTGIRDMSQENGLIKFIKNIISMNNEYKKEDLAILVLSEVFARNLNDVFQQHWPESSVQRAEKYPPEGIIIDTLKNFHGLDAPFVVFVLDGCDISNTKLKIAIASRGIQRVEFVREEVAAL